MRLNPQASPGKVGVILVLIRKRPDGLFERVLPDGRIDLFTLVDDTDEAEWAGARSSLSHGAPEFDRAPAQRGRSEV